MLSGRAQPARFLLHFTFGVFTLVLTFRPALTTIAELADPTKARLRTPLRLGGFMGFIGGFLMAYQRSSCESTRLVILCYY